MATDTLARWPRGDSAMAVRVRDHGWAATPLGPTERWPDCLKTTVDLMLDSRSMMSLVWGPKAIHLYNDAFTELLSEHRDTSLGRSAFETFARSRNAFASDLSAGMAGQSARLLAKRYPVLRNGQREDALFDVEYAPVRDDAGEVAGVLWTLREVTSQVLTEQALRESESRQAFLLRLSDALRPLTDGAELERAAVELLGRELRASRVFYATIDVGDESWSVAHDFHAGVLASNAGQYSLSGFQRSRLDQWRAGHTTSVADSDSDARLNADERAAYAAFGARAGIGVPLIHGDRLAALLVVNQIEPRQWTTAEIALTQETAERTWVAIERARAEAALRESEERQSFLLELGDAMRSKIGVDNKIKVAAGLLGRKLGASRILYAEYDWDRGVALIFNGWFADGAQPFPTVMRLEEYEGEVLNDLRSGRTVRIDNVGLRVDEPGFAAIAAVGVQALLSPPLMIGGQLKMNLSVHQEAPRPWTDHEVALVEEVAERLWAEIVRARAEAALRESDARNRLLINSWAQAVWETNAEGVVEVDSPSWRASTGQTVNQWLGDGWLDAIHPEDRLEAERRWHDAIATRSPVDAEIRLRSADGNWRWTNVRAAPVFDADGRIEKWAAMNIDIDDRKRALDALQESEDRFRTIAEGIEDVFYLTDLDRDELIYLSPGFERIWGRRPEELEADLGFFMRTIHPDDLERVIAGKAAQNQGEAVEIEYRIVRPDQSVRWIYDRCFPVPTSNGRRSAGLASDITEAHRIQMQLAESERRLRTLAEGIPQLVWRAVDGGHWTWASPQWSDYTGQPMIDSRDWGWLDPVHPDDRERVKRIWSEAMVRGAFHADYRICHKAEGRYRWFQTRATPVRDNDGHVIEWLGTSTDVDDMRQLQGRQQVLVAELQHRTRNLMGIVRSTAERTSRTSVDLADFRDRFRDRLEALARVQGLLSRLNDTDRVAFDELIRSEVAAMMDSTDRVTLDGPAGVKLKSGAVQILALALHELATNATKYGALSEPAGHLSVTWRVDEDRDGSPHLHVDWREEGVATALAHTEAKRGGGRDLIERALPHQLGAKTTYVFEPAGVHCTIELPISTMA